MLPPPFARRREGVPVQIDWLLVVVIVLVSVLLLLPLFFVPAPDTAPS